MTKIVEKYFTQNDFSKREEEVLGKVTQQTGFEPKELIFKGTIYDPDKVGSIIYRGIYQDKDAVLKLQGLQPEIDEPDIIENFKAQNLSKRIRLPELFGWQKWNEKMGYGWLITEFIDAPKIFEKPFATPSQMDLFCNFYQEYRANSLNKAWLKKDEEGAADFIIRRVEIWRNISDHKAILRERISSEKTKERIERYKKIMRRELSEIEMVFCHGHLTAEDILIEENGNFVLLSNLYWTYRPELYDLVFNVWGCMQHIKDPNFDYGQLKSFFDEWFKRYYQILVVATDLDAKRKINLMLLERMMGAILIDTGSRPIGKDEKATRNLLSLQARFFDEISEKF